MPINQPSNFNLLILLPILFHSSYESVAKAISVCKQVLPILYRLPVTCNNKYHLDAAAQYSTKV